jgi:hypothetical protein
VCLRYASYESRDETSKLPNVLLLLLLTTSFSTCHCSPLQSLGPQAHRTPGSCKCTIEAIFEFSCITASVQKYLLAAASIVAIRHSLSMRILSTLLRFPQRKQTGSQYHVTPSPSCTSNIGVGVVHSTGRDGPFTASAQLHVNQDGHAKFG